MKVTVITSFPFPNGKATANRVQAFVDEMQRVERINQAEVISCSEEKSGESFIDGFTKISNIQVKSINKNRLFLRALCEVIVAIDMWKRARASNADVILVTVPSIWLLIPIIFTTERETIALDVRDVVWTYLGEGLISKIIAVIIKIIFLWAAKRADIISVTNTWESRHVAALVGTDPLIVPNGISKDRLLEMKSLKLNPGGGAVKLAYVGNVGIAQELNDLLDFAKKMPELEVTIVGDGAKLEELSARRGAENIDNVSFTGLVSLRRVLYHVGRADILFAQIGKNFSSAVPTKVFEYIASGKKVLLGLPDGPARDVFSRFSGVEIFDVGNSKQLEMSFSKLVRIDIDCEARENNLRLLETDYTRENGAVQLVQAILEVVGSQNDCVDP